ncbi:MAG: hypothetical protein IJR14_00035 [Synergistaceae bacterium]|nr:hypothetical protein [Synergistaceae bacterium]
MRQRAAAPQLLAQKCGHVAHVLGEDLPDVRRIVELVPDHRARLGDVEDMSDRPLARVEQLDARRAELDLAGEPIVPQGHRRARTRVGTVAPDQELVAERILVVACRARQKIAPSLAALSRAHLRLREETLRFLQAIFPRHLRRPPPLVIDLARRSSTISRRQLLHVHERQLLVAHGHVQHALEDIAHVVGQLDAQRPAHVLIDLDHPLPDTLEDAVPRNLRRPDQIL